NLGQRTIKRFVDLADGTMQLLAYAARRTAREPFLEDKIVSGFVSLVAIAHRLPRLALRSRSRIVSRNSRAISTCAIRASRARARWGRPATLRTLFAVGMLRLRCLDR